jgi:1-acyl-sn-glycerol-3-phosphate acyltransferase
MVAETVRIIGESDHFILALAPEGTRRRVAEWKTGFYRVALGARIPVVLGSIDFAKRVVDFGPTIWPSGDIEADMALIQRYYGSFKGKNPELFGIKAG